LAELGCENIVFDCPCFYSYFSNPDEDGNLLLDPAAIEKLLEGSRSVGPDVRSFHVANVNPGVVAGNQEGSEKITKLMLKHCSDGNFPNLRVVTFDDDVALQNNTQATWEESTAAIEMLAKDGADEGSGGLPKLLPTIELVYGLAGEREETMEINISNLRELAEGGKIRGVVARSLVPIPGTPISKRDDLVDLEGLDAHMNALGEEINQLAGRALAEPGRLIRDVFPYKVVENWAAAKKIGVNPVELRVHGATEINAIQDVRITSVGNGGLEAVSQPLVPKTVSRDILRLVPSMTEEIIDQFMRQRPQQAEDFYHLFDEPQIARMAASYFDFGAGD
jgi:radical SAM superfamily enzyme with C-terminal helix-hairpin-helix motif